MTSGGILVLHLAIAIGIVLTTILYLRWTPMLALLLGSLYMGLGSGLGVETTVGAITEGFGNLMAGIGFSIGFGVIIGQLLHDAGGALAVARSVTTRLPPRLIGYGLGVTAFLFSIPVFFDVTFVILVPLALSISAETRRPRPYAVGAVVIGAATAHTLVPPTPNPLAAASIFEFDLGLMIFVGLGVGLMAALLAMKLYFMCLDCGLWSSDKDEAPETAADLGAKPVEVPEACPGLALVPIVLALFLILLGTCWSMIADETPAIVRFLSHKVVAMLAGAVAAYWVASKTLNKAARESSVNRAMGSAGVVLLVTGAGGAFGSVIQATGIGSLLTEGLGQSAHGGVWAILAAFAIAMVFRVSQGSGTVASITAMTLLAGAQVPEAAGLHPVWLALASLAGGISIGHVNDSGFWVTTKLSGFTLTGGLKTYTLAEAIVSVLVLALTLVGSLVWPDF